MNLLDDVLDQQRDEQDYPDGPSWLPLSVDANAHKADLPGVVGLIAVPFALLGWTIQVIGLAS